MAKTVIDTRSFDVAQDDSGNDPFSPRLQRGMHGRARQGDRSGSSYHLPYRNAIISRQFVQTVAQRWSCELRNAAQIQDRSSGAVQIIPSVTARGIFEQRHRFGAVRNQIA